MILPPPEDPPEPPEEQPRQVPLPEEELPPVEPVPEAPPLEIEPPEDEAGARVALLAPPTLNPELLELVTVEEDVPFFLEDVEVSEDSLGPSQF